MKTRKLKPPDHLTADSKRNLWKSICRKRQISTNLVSMILTTTFGRRRDRRKEQARAILSTEEQLQTDRFNQAQAASIGSQSNVMPQ